MFDAQQKKALHKEFSGQLSVVTELFNARFEPNTHFLNW